VFGKILVTQKRSRKEILIDIRIRELSCINIWPNPVSAGCQLYGRSECPERFPVMPYLICI